MSWAHLRLWHHCTRHRRLSRTAATVATLVGIAGPAYYFSRKASIHLDTEEDAAKNINVSIATPPEGLQGAELELRRWEYSAWYDHDILQIPRWDFNCIQSENDPDEYTSFNLFHTSQHQWSYFGIFDGLLGPETSYWVYSNLVSTVARHMRKLYVSWPQTRPDLPSIADVEQVFKDAFEAVDNALVHDTAREALDVPVRDEAVEVLTPAYTGSCATVASYHAQTRLLHIGHVGHSRAVLGRRVARPDGRGYIYEVRQLTTDHISRTLPEGSCSSSSSPPDSQDDSHPELTVSRAFGFGRYKWSEDLQKRLAEKRLLNIPPGTPYTPPLPLSASPEVITTKTESGDFLILAGQGFWNRLTNAEAVGLVGWWLESRGFEPTGEYRNTRRQPQSPKDLPVHGNHNLNPRMRPREEEPRFVNLDFNVATHLLRNALGGADWRRVNAELDPYPEDELASRREDMSVFVIFFA